MRIGPVILAILLLVAAAPAMAATAVPEPSDFALFLLGVAGLIVGRSSAKARRSASEDDSAA